MTRATLTLAGLSIWIAGRQFADNDDYWDGNWLQTIARVDTPGATVKAQGAFIRVDELKMFESQLQQVYDKLAGKAKLELMEPDLSIVVTAKSRGIVMVEINITPDHLTQSHRFEFEIDQSYLPATLIQLSEILT